LACHFQRFEEALDLFNANWQGKRDLDAEEIVLSMRFCSELKDWNQASQYAEQLMRRGFSLMDDSYGYFQIIRRSDRHLEFLSIIGESGRDDEFSCCIRDLLVDDLCVLSGRSAVDTPLGSRSISERNAILVKGHISEEALSETNQQAIFLCTDKAYFFSVLTMLASLATWSVDSADCYIFLSNDVPRHWVPSLEDFCRRLGIEIFVIYEDHLSIASNGCSVEYGLFSGGRSLARAAYFRIYAAKWLWQKQTYRRVLYVDSDIVCQKPLNSVFHLDLRGKAMAARPEEINDGVRKASKKCEVDIGEYINSGVILFDLCHPRMEELLDGAIWQAENGGPRLTFHDQCALNIAFAGQIAHLPSRFNYYLRPFKHYGENDLRDGTLLHYLDRPKPWDSGCNFSHRHPWTAAAHTVRTLVSPDYYYETVATSLGRTVQQQMKSTNELHSGIASPKISYLTHHAPKIVSHA
jgi:lipopolysaccharide biosynthesis glycosyltransferase